jgi:hypothetical protein
MPPPDEHGATPAEDEGRTVDHMDIGSHPEGYTTGPSDPLDVATRTVIDHFPGTIDVTHNGGTSWPIPWNSEPLPGTDRSPFDHRGFPKDRGR